MTYDEFKNTFSLNDLKNIKNPDKEVKTYIDETNHKLYDLLFILGFNLFTIDLADYLTKEDMNKKINILLKEQQEKHDELIANRILSYEDFKKRISCNNEGDIDIDLYSEEELYNLSKWSIQAREELFNARKKSNILTENINSENDMLTKEEMDIPFQDLINKYEKL